MSAAEFKAQLRSLFPLITREDLAETTRALFAAGVIFTCLWVVTTLGFSQ